MSLEAVRAETHEPEPNIRVAPGVLRVSRRGVLAEELTVWLKFEGSATPGQDYEVLPAQVTIPSHRESLDLLVTALDDEIGEGPETVVALLQPDPGMGPRERYTIEPGAAAAKVQIFDGHSAPRTSVRITAPLPGMRFRQGEPIAIEAVAIDSAGFIEALDFFADGEKIGESVLAWPACVGCEPKPGDPAKHAFIWNAPPAGRHELWATASHRLILAPSPEEETIDPPATSVPVEVNVVGMPSSVRFAVHATRPVAEESSLPYKRIPLTGELVISRTGDLAQPAAVFVQYEGEAKAGVDYEPLPWRVEIPAGERAVALEVRAIPDEVTEGAEKLVATLSVCPPSLDPPSELPCLDVDINPEFASAGIVLCDDARCGRSASLELTHPRPGTKYRAGESVPVRAVAIDPLGAIYRVEFWAGEERVGVSELWTFREPDPGDPMHHEFVWKGARPGTHLLTARATDSAGAPLVSAPVEVTIVTSPALKVSILTPPKGAVFGPDDAVEVHAVASSESARIQRLEVYGDDSLLGSTDSGELKVSWDQPPLGVHKLIARASSDDGQTATSEPVRFLVRPEPARGYVERSLPPTYTPGQSLEVLLASAPPQGAQAWAVADRPPAGWSVSDMSPGGSWDAAWGVVRFGPFSDTQTRTLSYQVLPPEASKDRQVFSGKASVDGKVSLIRGDRLILPSRTAPDPAEPALTFRGYHRQGQEIRFEVGGKPGVVCEIEVSSDLKRWEHHSTVFVLEDGTVPVMEDRPSENRRFFRARPVSEP